MLGKNLFSLLKKELGTQKDLNPAPHQAASLLEAPMKQNIFLETLKLIYSPKVGIALHPNPFTENSPALYLYLLH